MRDAGRRLKERLAAFAAGVPRRERVLLAGAMVLSFVLPAIYVLATRSRGLGGDEVLYHEYGVLFTEGKPWHATVPFGEERASAWKPPGYPAWVGLWYSLLGTSALRLAMAQALLAPLTVLLTWLLARRLFGARVAIAAALVTALFPLVWEYYALLFPEAVAIPLTLGALLVILDRPPSMGRSVGAGLLIGAGLLVRPNAFILFAPAAVAWVLAAGLRRGAVATAVAIAVAALTILPWTVRNYVVTDGAVIPLSVQDSAVYGTFNEEAAADGYLWRPLPAVHMARIDELRAEQAGDAEIRSVFYELAWDYIRDNPHAMPAAFLHNGLLRFWELRPPSDALAEVPFQGRSRTVRAVGLATYYPLLLAAIAGLWRLRRRRDLLLPILALAALASITFTMIAGTRYRAPLEPVIVILACSLLAPRCRVQPSPSGRGAANSLNLPAQSTRERWRSEPRREA